MKCLPLWRIQQLLRLVEAAAVAEVAGSRVGRLHVLDPARRFLSEQNL